MVAPIIAGVAALGGVVLGAVLGAPKKVLYAVVWITHKGVEGKKFPSFEHASNFQDQIAARGRGSILIERNLDGDYAGLRAIRAVAPGGRKIHPGKLRKMKHSYGGDQMSANAASAFDTSEEALEVSQATTRLPNPAWVDRMNKGPYPETNPGHQDYMPEAPLFDETTSSHMWKSDVTPWEVPGKYFPGGKNGGQPDELVVEQALQYPEHAPDAAVDGGKTIMDLRDELKARIEAKEREAAGENHPHQGKHKGHVRDGGSRGMFRQAEELVEEFDESGQGIEAEGDQGRGSIKRIHQPKEMKA